MRVSASRRLGLSEVLHEELQEQLELMPNAQLVPAGSRPPGRGRGGGRGRASSWSADLGLLVIGWQPGWVNPLRAAPASQGAVQDDLSAVPEYPGCEPASASLSARMWDPERQREYVCLWGQSNSPSFLLLPEI